MLFLRPELFYFFQRDCKLKQESRTRQGSTKQEREQNEKLLEDNWVLVIAKAWTCQEYLLRFRCNCGTTDGALRHGLRFYMIAYYRHENCGMRSTIASTSTKSLNQSIGIMLQIIGICNDKIVMGQLSKEVQSRF